MRRLLGRYFAWLKDLSRPKRLIIDGATVVGSLALVGVIFVQGWCWGLWFNDDVLLTALFQCRVCSEDSERARWAPAQVLVSACLQPFLVSVSPNQDYAVVTVQVARWPTPSLLPLPWSGEPDRGKVGRLETRVYALHTGQYEGFGSGAAILDNGFFLTSSPQPLSGNGALKIIPMASTNWIPFHEEWTEGIPLNSDAIDRIRQAETIFIVTYFNRQIDPAIGSSSQGQYAIFVISPQSSENAQKVLVLTASIDPTTLAWFRQNSANAIVYNMVEEAKPRVWGGGYRYVCCNGSGAPSMLFYIRYLPYYAPVLTLASATQ